MHLEHVSLAGAEADVVAGAPRVALARERVDDVEVLRQPERGRDLADAVVNLDPFSVHDGVCVIPPSLGLAEHLDVVDALTGESYAWGTRNYVRLGPGKAHVLEVHT